MLHLLLGPCDGPETEDTIPLRETGGLARRGTPRQVSLTRGPGLRRSRPPESLTELPSARGIIDDDIEDTSTDRSRRDEAKGR
jgi:hypothetical protein